MHGTNKDQDILIYQGSSDTDQEEMLVPPVIGYWLHRLKGQVFMNGVAAVKGYHLQSENRILWPILLYFMMKGKM